MIVWDTLETPVGPLFVAAEERGIVSIGFLRGSSVAGELARLEKAGFGPADAAAAARPGAATVPSRGEAGPVRRADPARSADPEGTAETRAAAHVRAAIAQLDDYFSGRARGFDLDLWLVGTDFQEKIWREIAKIPWGGTCSYGELARATGLPATAIRAVGGAVGDNPVAIVVPCHRVLGAKGALTGFGGGIDAKKWLLDHEAGVLGLPLMDGGSISVAAPAGRRTRAACGKKRTERGGGRTR
jgi:methylated-DNA-[protein]-cysteine S-methyltransferase